VLVTYASWAFVVIKYLGAGYLVYLGIRAMVSSGRVQSRKDLPPASLPAIFRQGMFTNVLNPKVALFFLSFLPQFVHPERGSVALQTLILGIIFNFNGTIVNVLVGWLFGHVGGWLERSGWWWKLQRWVSGSVLVGLGISLALPDRR
ncbi:MAG: LysE family translocator, partial [candidate division Zixibacteria bacterium]|nr:LysE family translocator [candidate division Zixibacteria bacterium]